MHLLWCVKLIQVFVIDGQVREENIHVALMDVQVREEIARLVFDGHGGSQVAAVDARVGEGHDGHLVDGHGGTHSRRLV